MSEVAVEARSCWVATDGRAGTEVPCVGLAEALGLLAPVIKRVRITAPWRWLPSGLVPAPLAHVNGTGDGLAPPWPDVLIASGRKLVAPAAALRRRARGRTFVIQVQDPQIALERFDVVVAPEHDGLSGPNVVTVLGSLTRVTPERLAAEGERLGGRFAHLPRPRVAVCVGGNSRTYRMTDAVVHGLADGLTATVREHGAGLMVTMSRRTGPAHAAQLRRALADLPAEIWDGTGDNPYFAMLGLADHIVVTGDSVNMVSEAATTGKPVHLVMLEGGSARFERFHRAMREAGITRPFDGTLGTWTYTPLDETRRAAAEISKRLPARAAAAE